MVAVISVFSTVPKVHAPRINNTYIPYIACDTKCSIKSMLLLAGKKPRSLESANNAKSGEQIHVFGMP